MTTKEALEDSSEKLTITSADLVAVFKEHFKYIISIFLIFTITVYLITFFIPNQYQSFSLLSVANENAPRVTGGLSSLASITGVNIGNSNKPNEIIETIKSRKFLERLIKDDSLIPILSAAKSFEPETKEVIFNQKFFDHKNNKWKLDNNGESYRPNLLKLHRDYYIPFLNVYINKMNNLIYLSFSHKSPQIAYEINNLIINELNLYMKEKKLKELDIQNDFIKLEQEKNLDTVTMKYLNELIQSNLEQKMITSSTLEYAVKVLDAPYIPDKKYKPRRSIIALVSSVFFTLCYLLLLFYRKYRAS